MMDRTGVKIATHIGMLTALMIAFRSQALLTTTDAIFHYSLIHWLYTKEGVLATDPDSLLFAVYPSASHWLAAIVGWAAGSYFVGMILVTIAALYLSYLFIALLVQRDRY